MGAATVTCTSATNSVAATCMNGYFKNADACTACTSVANAATVTCTDADDSIAITCNDGANFLSANECGKCDVIANAVVMCTWPGNSVVASCDTGFDKTDGACVAAATADAPSASLSAATSLVQSWSSIIVAAVMLVGIF